MRTVWCALLEKWCFPAAQLQACGQFSGGGGVDPVAPFGTRHGDGERSVSDAMVTYTDGSGTAVTQAQGVGFL